MTPAIIICFHIMVPLKTICPVISVVFNVMFGAFREESCKDVQILTNPHGSQGRIGNYWKSALNLETKPL